MVIFWACFFVTITESGSHLNILSSQMDPWFRVIQLVGWLAIIATIFCIFNFFGLRGVPGRWWWAKVHDVLLVLAFLLSIWLMIFTHLLSFSLNY